MKNIGIYNSTADTTMFACQASCKACNGVSNNASEIAICKHLLYNKNFGNKVNGIDIGAHVGIYSIALRGFISKMYSFELNPEIYNVMLKNMVNYPNIVPFNLATWEDNRKGHPLIQERMEAVYNFECVALDSVSELPNAETIGFIKLDIEGAETHTLRGMKKLLTQCQNTVLEIEYCKRHFKLYKVSETEFLDILTSCGFNYAGPMDMQRVKNAGEIDVLNLFFTK